MQQNETNQAPPATLEAGKGKPRVPFNVRVASQSYSNIAAVIAGFAVAAVVLVVSNTSNPSHTVDA